MQVKYCYIYIGFFPTGFASIFFPVSSLFSHFVICFVIFVLRSTVNYFKLHVYATDFTVTPLVLQLCCLENCSKNYATWNLPPPLPSRSVQISISVRMQKQFSDFSSFNNISILSFQLVYLVSTDQISVRFRRI